MNEEAKRRLQDFAIVACIVSACTTTGLALASLFNQVLPWRLQSWHYAIVFIAACGFSTMAAWLSAIVDRRLAPRPGAAPCHEHISGWTIVFIVLFIIMLANLAAWASAHLGSNALSSVWSLWAFWAAAIFLSAAAFLPEFNLEENRYTHGLISLAKKLRLALPIRWIGLFFSYLDMVLVHAISCSSAMHARSPWVRYSISLIMLASCIVLGLTLSAPWGLIPIGWLFILALALLRRWTFLERDLDRIYTRNSIFDKQFVVGFGRNYHRDALLASITVLLLLPLTLRQAHMWSLDLGNPIFVVGSANINDFSAWIELVGAEVAKAMPFVDWSEVYGINAAGKISLGSGQLSHHILFGIRVVIDAIILGSLLQAVGSFAKHKDRLDLFYEGRLDRLDPFLERRELGRLVRRNKDGWEVNKERFSAFPRYDVSRLTALRFGSADARILAAVNLLLRRDYPNNIEYDSADAHE